jgi:hypothetical protein
MDPVEQEKMRRKQILQLARYGRVGGLHDWDEESVDELRAWYQALKEVLDSEEALGRVAENR